MPNGFKVIDPYEKEVVLGSRVMYGVVAEENVGEVTAISEPDADYDDELQRGVEVTPRVTVTFADGSTDLADTYNTSRFDYPGGETIYMADDLEVIA